MNPDSEGAEAEQVNEDAGEAREDRSEGAVMRNVEFVFGGGDDDGCGEGAGEEVLGGADGCEREECAQSVCQFDGGVFGACDELDGGSPGVGAKAAADLRIRVDGAAGCENFLCDAIGETGCAIGHKVARREGETRVYTSAQCRRRKNKLQA